MRDQTILAANVLPGDLLVSASLGGDWGGVEVLGVKNHGGIVEVVLAGRAQAQTFCGLELLVVRRAAQVGTPSEQQGWSVDAELAEVTP